MTIDWEQFAAKDETPAASSVDWEQFAAPNIPNTLTEKVMHAAPIVGNDIKNLAENIPSAVAQTVTGIPKDINSLRENIPLAVNQVKTDPLRALRNVVAGGSDLAGQVANIPPALVDYLARIGMIKPQTAAMYARPPANEEIATAGNAFVGGNEQPGDTLLRGLTKNAPQIYGGLKVASALNPMQLTYKNLAKSALNAENEMKEKYSGPNGLYAQSFNEARSRGITGDRIDPNKIDINTLKEYASPKMTESTEELLQNKSLENAQKSVKDLGSLQRRLEGKTFLLEPEKKLLTAAKNAKEHIQTSMFTDQSGNFHPDLFDKYQQIQKGYAGEVVPYSTNQDIKAFKRGEMSAEDLIKRLSGGKFAAKRGVYHPAISTRNLLNTIFGNKLSQLAIGGAALGSGYEGSKYLMSKLLGENQ